MQRVTRRVLHVIQARCWSGVRISQPEQSTIVARIWGVVFGEGEMVREVTKLRETRLLVLVDKSISDIVRTDGQILLLLLYNSLDDSITLRYAYVEFC